MFFISLKAFPQQGVSVNTTGVAPHASAMLDVSYTSKGVLIPRMTNAQLTAIAGHTTTSGYFNYIK